MISLRSFLLPAFLVVVGELLYGQNPTGPVWGFADLHSHPASHLGFGSDQNGNNGLFWGKPAHDGSLDLNNSSLPRNLLNDLPACANSIIGFTHNSSTNDPVKLFTDHQIVSKFDGTAPGYVHQSGGYPGFQGWPAALTVDHQVMHINSINRAFQGGLRLLSASVTNDEIVNDLWNQGFNNNGNPMPTHDASFDYNSAVKQLTYITNLVNANSTWMTIVTTPAQARAAINSTPPKLAVVLSLEMDSLSLGQIQSLVQQFGVAHVIPIHLVNNSFGGTAVYNDQFNGLSNFINGSFYSVNQDPNVSFLLGTPQVLQPVNASSISGGWPIPGCIGNIFNCPAGTFGYMPQNVDPATFASLNYPATTANGGDVNALGLNQSQFLTLMQMHLLLDVAHMGELSSSQALALAQQYHYPLMDSHTGIRCDTNCSTPYGSPAKPGSDERSLPTSQLAIIQQLGGVIGLGEVPGFLGNPPSPDPDPVKTWINNYSIALSLMGGKGVALGTDANGLSPLIQQDTIATNYPITVASQFGCPAGCPSLNQYQLGNRTFNFQNDGIATYGLLPDFIQAASESRPISVPYVVNAQCAQGCTAAYNKCVKNWQPGDHWKGTQSPCGAEDNTCWNNCPHTGGGSKPGPPPTTQITALFHSAEDTIEMWEAVEKAVVVLPLTISSSTRLANSWPGSTYSQTLTASGGTPPYTWSIQSGSLPPGLTLSKNGTIAGTLPNIGHGGFPSDFTSGFWTFNAMAQDSGKPTPATGTKELTIYISVSTPTNECPSGQVFCQTLNIPRCSSTCPVLCPDCRQK